MAKSKGKGGKLKGAFGKQVTAKVMPATAPNAYKNVAPAINTNIGGGGQRVSAT